MSRDRPEPTFSRLVSCPRALPFTLAVAVMFCSGGGDADPEDPAQEPRGPAGEIDPDADGRVTPEISLVDSLGWEDALASGVNRRVVVRIGRGVDTVPGVAVAREPVMTGDSAVTGFDREGATIERGFWYAPGSGSVKSVALPENFLDFTAHALAPDGSRLAYVGQADDGVQLVAAVRAWPSGEAIWTSAAVEGYPSDAMNSSVEWMSSDSVEIRIRLDALESGRDLWLRAAGDPGETMSVDTLDMGE